ncbi:MAG: isoprenylcysteine carboxylmethyltransferase family protein [Chloroflexota bacterium]
MAYQVAFAVIFGAGFMLAAAHRFHATRLGGNVSEKTEKEQVPITYAVLRLGGAAVWVTAIMYAINPAWTAWANIDLPGEARWFGATIGAMALPFMLWAIRSIGGNVTRTVATRDNHELVTWGPYRYIRHPLYTFGFILFIGLGLLSGNVILLSGVVVALVAIIRRLPHEEAQLRQRFGSEYDTYVERTGRFTPKVWAKL